MFEGRDDASFAHKSIYTVIAKPTRACNADCSYCAAPPYDREQWTIGTFKLFFDKLKPYLADGATWLWHGGEPMLMGAQFFIDAKEYAESQGVKLSWSMQTNILKYQSSKWKDVFENVFQGSISTSYDPDEKDRTVRGSAERYNKQFFKALNAMYEDGFDAFIIGVFDDNNIDYANKLYDLALKHPNKTSIRVNYKVPVGRANDGAQDLLIDPYVYGSKLVELQRRREQDCADIGIIPNDILEARYHGRMGDICPWTSTCGGKIISIEPNGDMYNCDNYAELGEKDFCFGNLKNDTLSSILTSKPMNQIKSRAFTIHDDCLGCEFYHACKGGCSRDSYIHTGDTNGKFPYCHSWKMILNEIKGKK